MKRVSRKRKRIAKLVAIMLMTVLVVQLFVAGLSAIAVDSPRDAQESISNRMENLDILDGNVSVLPVGLSTSDTFKVSVDDIYLDKMKDLSKKEKEDMYLELGYSSVDDMEDNFQLFNISYTNEAGGNAEVKDGDRVPDGTVLKVEVKPEKGPRTVLFNEEKEQTDEGEWVTTTFEHTIGEDVEIKLGDALVTIDDPYVKIAEMAEEADAATAIALNVGADSVGTRQMFFVSYKPIDLTNEEIALGLSDDDVKNLDPIDVEDGDYVPVGAELIVIAKPAFGGIKVLINDQEYSTAIGLNKENEFKHLVEGDVTIKPSVGISLFSIANTGAGPATNANYGTGIDAGTNTTTNHSHTDEWGGVHVCTITTTPHGTCIVRSTPTTSVAQMKSMMTLVLADTAVEAVLPTANASAYKCISGVNGVHHSGDNSTVTLEHKWNAWSGFTFDLNGGTLSISNDDLNRYFTGNRPLTVTNGTLVLNADSGGSAAYAGSVITLGTGAKLQTTTTITDANIVFTDATVTHGNLNFGAGVTVSSTASPLVTKITSNVGITMNETTLSHNYEFVTTNGSVSLTKIKPATMAITSITSAGSVVLDDFTVDSIGDITAGTGVIMTSVTVGNGIGTVTAQTGNIVMDNLDITGNAGNITASKGNITMDDVVVSMGDMGNISAKTGITMDTVAVGGKIGDILNDVGSDDGAASGITMKNIIASGGIGDVTNSSESTAPPVLPGGSPKPVGRDIDMSNVITPTIGAVNSNTGSVRMTTVNNGVGVKTTVPSINAGASVTLTTSDLTVNTGDVKAGGNIDIVKSNVGVSNGNMEAGVSVNVSGTSNVTVTVGNITATRGNVDLSGPCEVTVTNGNVVAGATVRTSGTSTLTVIVGYIRGLDVAVVEGTTMNKTGGNIEASRNITVSGTAFANNLIAGNKIKANMKSIINNGSAANFTQYLDAKFIEITGEAVVNATNAYGNFYNTSTATAEINNVTGLGYVYIDSANYTFINVFGGGLATGSCPIPDSPGMTLPHSNHQHFEGAVTMTIKAGTFTGQLYAGGNEVAAGNIQFALLGGTLPTGQHAYGGSLNANAKDITMWVSDAIFDTNIYGGSHAKNTNANAGNVIMHLGNQQAAGKTVYGGGHAVGGTADVLSTSITTYIDPVTILDTEINHPSTSGFPAMARPIMVGGAVTGVNNNNFTNIYGGGHAAVKAASVTNDTTLNIRHKVNTNIYGGGHALAANATVGGNTTVTFSSNTVNSTAVTVQNIFGGGHAPTANFNASVGTNGTAKSTVNANGTVAIDVYGGGWAAAAGTTANANDTAVNVNKADITGMPANGKVTNAYGGGFADVDDTTTATVKDANVTVYDKSGTTSPVTANVYGGGHSKIGNAAANSTKVLVAANGIVDGNVYGGGFGDGTTTANYAKIAANTTVTITGTVSQNVFGGGTGLQAPVGGFVTMNVTGTGAKKVDGNIYGGGDNNPIQGANATNKSVVMTIDGGTINTTTGNVYGGGFSNTAVDANLGKGVLIDIKGASAINGNVYGGGSTGDGTNAGTTATVNSDIDIIVDGASTIVKTLYGGGVSDETAGAAVDKTKTTGNVNIKVQGASIIKDSLFGGGTSLPQTATMAARNTSDIDGFVNIHILNSTIEKDVYGGGDHNDILKATPAGVAVTLVVENSKLNTTAGNTYAGGLNAELKSGGTSVHNAGNSVITGNLYGGGNSSATNNQGNDTNASSALVKGNVTILTDAGSKVEGKLHGGGTSDDGIFDQAIIDGIVNIVHNGTVIGDLYGGGEYNKVDNSAGADWAVTVVVGGTGRVGDGSNPSDLYGGTLEAEVDGSIKIETLSDSIVYGNLYGGGNGDNGNDASTHGHTDVTVRGSVNKTVYGGGTNTAPIDEYTVVNIFAGKIGDKIGESVYGGGAHVDAPIKSHDKNTATPNKEGYSTKVTIDGFVGADVYGGSRQTDILYNTLVIVQSKETPSRAELTEVKGAVFGASHEENGNAASVHGVTHVEITGGHIMGSGVTPYGTNGAVFGGGSGGSNVLNKIPTNDLTLEHATTVLIKGVTEDVIIDNHVFGGGEKSGGTASSVDGSTYVDMTYGTIIKDKDIYGGGYDSPVEGYTEVWVGPGEPVISTNPCNVGGSVYGGGIFADGVVNHLRGTYVTIRENGHIFQNVYGGGAEGAHLTGINTSGSKPGTTPDFGTNVYIKGIVGSDDATVAEKGDVYGGGREADVNANLINGTEVTVHYMGHVYENVFGGGWDGDILGTNGTDVRIYGLIGIDTTAIGIGSNDTDRGNVYGGGRDGNVDGTGGTEVHIGREEVVGATNSAFVRASVYGGGFGETEEGEVKYSTDILVDGDSTVQQSVFGGGRGPGEANADRTFGKVHENTNVEVTGQFTLIGKRATPDIFDNNKHLTFNAEFMFRGEEKTTLQRERGRVQPNNSDVNTWLDVGNVYAGGSWAEIGKDMNVNIHDMDQKAFNRISGGNLGIVSANPVRNVDITNIGIGLSGPRAAGDTVINDLTNDKFYTDLYKYTAVRFLQDFTTTNQNDSYLTVYYNLKTTDDGWSIHGIHNTHNSVNHVNSGVYHSWRPKEHTDVLIENYMEFHDSAMFRMETDYTVNFEAGIDTDNPASPMQSGTNDLGHKIVLLLDVAKDIEHNVLRLHHDGSKTRILGKPNSVTENTPFAFWEILGTNVRHNLQDRNGPALIGISIYIPPMNIKSLGIENTNHGGINKPDYGAMYDIVPEMMADGNSYLPVDNTAVNRLAAIFAKSPLHITDLAMAVSENALIATAQATLNRTNNTSEYIVRQAHAGKVTFEGLKAVKEAARIKASTIEYQADTINKDGNVEGRMYIDTSKLTNQIGAINTDIHACKEEVARPTKIFKKFFTNDMAVVKIGQTGELKTTVHVAVKVDLSKLNTKSLQIFAYTEKTNQFTPVDEYDYYIDTNGYLHFYTSIGGDIIITDSDLALKK